jgi:hypothetical protein
MIYFSFEKRKNFPFNPIYIGHHLTYEADPASVYNLRINRLVSIYFRKIGYEDTNYTQQPNMQENSKLSV